MHGTNTQQQCSRLIYILILISKTKTTHGKPSQAYDSYRCRGASHTDIGLPSMPSYRSRSMAPTRTRTVCLSSRNGLAETQFLRCETLRSYSGNANMKNILCNHAAPGSENELSCCPPVKMQAPGLVKALRDVVRKG